MTLTLTSSAASAREILGDSGTQQLLCDDPEETFPRSLHFSDAGLFLTTADSSALVNQTPQILNTNDLVVVLLSALNILISQAPTVQLTELSTLSGFSHPKFQSLSIILLKQHGLPQQNPTTPIPPSA